ncbi:hypothetical protein ACVGVM_23465 [Pseudonocardia bannensis]|uniref:Uncharacterized protein n=1 Tax=Pseudonocardia bannensis TaxID=630973 RepID=A0A848DLY5_9PSEU|nr:hypothetical protein [Pseudonocardia bannensis]NMH93394.1 hypothetical protein [Pseudonocardia bannensis]
MLVGGTSLAGYLGVRSGLAPLTARTIGEVAGSPPPGALLVRWTPAGGVERTDTVPLAVDAPAPGTGIEVAYDPADPARLVTPGAAVLADLDAAASGLAFAAAALAALLATAAFQLTTRRRAWLRRGRRSVVGRRVRIQRGLATRSWLELDTSPPRWLPVHFEPGLTVLPAPTVVVLHGDPARHRYLAASVPGPDGEVRLVPSGPVRSDEPSGRRLDNPATADDETRAALGRYGLGRHLRADLAGVALAPLVGLLGVALIGGGVPTWLAATALVAAGALCWAVVRGSDPS